jgi:hypothetical protein
MCSCAPPVEGGHDQTELAAALCQFVDRRTCRRWQESPASDLGLLELKEAGGEHVRRDPRQAPAQIGVPLRAESQLPDDLQRPPLAYKVERVSDVGGHSASSSFRDCRRRSVQGPASEGAGMAPSIWSRRLRRRRTAVVGSASSAIAPQTQNAH